METYGHLSRDYESNFLITLFISLCIYIGITAAVASTGQRKGLSYWSVFAFSFFTSPIGGLLYVIANLQQSAYTYTSPSARTFTSNEDVIVKEETTENDEPTASEEATSSEPSFVVKKGKWDVF